MSNQATVESVIRDPLILGRKSYHQITEDICRPVEGKANKYWWIAFIISASTMIWGVLCLAYTIGNGIGSWGLNKTVGWAWEITNFVWWIGIGHAGTLISAILLLFRQRWRMSRSCCTSANRTSTRSSIRLSWPRGRWWPTRF